MAHPATNLDSASLAGFGKSTSWRRTFLAAIHELKQGFADPYRPELHYMRGPGPAWHAKHGRVQMPESNA